mmetsp:Transcript_67381/g.191008  ORF Transcript_67381/g.191008 Transcript_67381/m.191008 type:complete len:220 (+) Transcript_67381:242-901(+)
MSISEENAPEGRQYKSSMPSQNSQRACRRIRRQPRGPTGCVDRAAGRSGSCRCPLKPETIARKPGGAPACRALSCSCSQTAHPMMHPGSEPTQVRVTFSTWLPFTLIAFGTLSESVALPCNIRTVADRCSTCSNSNWICSPFSAVLASSVPRWFWVASAVSRRFWLMSLGTLSNCLAFCCKPLTLSSKARMRFVCRRIRAAEATVLTAAATAADASIAG